MYINHHIVSLQSIIESSKELNTKFQCVESLKQLYENERQEFEEDDLTEEFLLTFYNDAYNSIKEIETKLKGLEEKYDKLIQYFGDTTKNMPIDTFIDILVKFSKELNVYNTLHSLIK